MRCPYCQNDNDNVRDSRTVDDGRAIRRRRVCNHCKKRFTTYERVEGSLLVIKKDGTRENYLREKIERGLERACWKRTVSAEQIQAMVAQIEQKVFDQFEMEVPTEDLGRIVLEELASVDEVAYVRFASVYRAFTDARDFVEELRPILRNAK